MTAALTSVARTGISLRWQKHSVRLSSNYLGLSIKHINVLCCTVFAQDPTAVPAWAHRRVGQAHSSHCRLTADSYIICLQFLKYRRLTSTQKRYTSRRARAE